MEESAFMTVRVSFGYIFNQNGDVIVNLLFFKQLPSNLIFFSSKMLDIDLDQLEFEDLIEQLEHRNRDDRKQLIKEISLCQLVNTSELSDLNEG